MIHFTKKSIIRVHKKIKKNLIQKQSRVRKMEIKLHKINDKNYLMEE